MSRKFKTLKAKTLKAKSLKLRTTNLKKKNVIKLQNGGGRCQKVNKRNKSKKVIKLQNGAGRCQSNCSCGRKMNIGPRPLGASKRLSNKYF